MIIELCTFWHIQNTKKQCRKQCAITERCLSPEPEDLDGKSYSNIHLGMTSMYREISNSIEAFFVKLEAISTKIPLPYSFALSSEMSKKNLRTSNWYVIKWQLVTNTIIHHWAGSIGKILPSDYEHFPTILGYFQQCCNKVWYFSVSFLSLSLMEAKL